MKPKEEYGDDVVDSKGVFMHYPYKADDHRAGTSYVSLFGYFFNQISFDMEFEQCHRMFRLLKKKNLALLNPSRQDATDRSGSRLHNK